MGQCSVCGKNIGFWEGDVKSRCRDCIKEPTETAQANTAEARPDDNQTFVSDTASYVTKVAWVVLVVGGIAAIVLWEQAGNLCSNYCDRYEEIEKASLITLGWSSAVGGILTSTLFFALGKITLHLAEISHRLKFKENDLSAENQSENTYT